MSVPEQFDAESRDALYRIMSLRRDVREFRSDPIPEATLYRILNAAQHAPSVGFSQPWAFVIVEEPATRAEIRQSFLRCRDAEAARFPAERREKYLSYKLEGIQDSALNLCVVADLRPRAEAILGTTVQPEAVRASVCCAVQNLWLAARAEGIGVGWVSIVEAQVLRRTLSLPSGVEPIAYLCVGYPKQFRERPLLEETQWLDRKSLVDIVHRERWKVEPSAVQQISSVHEHPKARIQPFAEHVMEQAIEHQALLTKPVGSLGRLEELAAWYAGAQRVFPAPPPDVVAHAVFAADHGVVVEGVSAYGSDVTAAMLSNIMAGGAAINVLARRLRIPITLVDVGVAGDVFSVPSRPEVELTRAKVRAGTGNIRRERAMSDAELERALDVGAETAQRAIQSGARLLCVGELGIGNTTSAAALICAFTHRKPLEVVGSGTGIDDTTRLHKVAVVEDSLSLHRPRADAPLETLAAIGGLELAAMTGYLLEAARHSVPVVLDGFLSSAAALAARAIDSAVVPYLLAAHASAELGSKLALEALGLRPVLELSMRLGEGTGALLVADIVRSAVALQSSMATFATLGIVSVHHPLE